MSRISTGENKNCLACGSIYYLPQWRAKRSNSRFCSLYCLNHKQYEGKRYKYVCLGCNLDFESSPSRKKSNKRYCSRQCIDKKTKERREQARIAMAKHRLKYKSNISSAALRKFVWTIKDKKCEICLFNEYDFLLDVHHIDQDPTNNAIDNLAVLCVMCHKKIHKGVIKDENFMKKRK